MEKNENPISLINNKDNNNESDIMNLIKDINFESLNEYYDIESSIFMKRIEKLNLKFYWTSEYLFLNKKEIIYPYNKLLLILFKQISLYIDEIARLNKQIKLNNKNEKYMKIKINKLKEKEKENLFNKQMIKNLQKNNKLLEKKNDKNIIELEKLKKKIFNQINYTNNSAKNTVLFSSPKNINSRGFDTINSNGSAFSKKSNMNKISTDLSFLSSENYYKKKKISNSIDARNIKKRKKNEDIDINEDIINKGISQCNDEIENLEIIENILYKFKNKNNNKNKSNKLNI